MRARLLAAALLAFAAILIPAAAASADSGVPLASVTASQFYAWCSGGKVTDVTPPAAPSNCGVYSSANSVSTATATFGSHQAGRITASVNLDPASRPVKAYLVVNGSAVQTITPASGWTSFQPEQVQASDSIAIGVKADWYGSGTAHLYAVHVSVAPWSSPPWSQFGAPGNWATTPIPANVAVQQGASPYGPNPLSVEVPREIQGQANAQSWVNEGAYSAPVYYQPLSTLNEPVRLCRWWLANCGQGRGVNDNLWRALLGVGNSATVDWSNHAACASNCSWIGGGVPMTDDVIGATGTDGTAIVCLGGGDSGDQPWTLPGFVRPDGQKMEGNCWELWDLTKDPAYDPSKPISPANTRFMVAFGMHETGFIRQSGSTPDNTYGRQLFTFSGRYCPRGSAGAWRCGLSSDAEAQQWFGPDVLVPGAADSTTELGAQQQGVTASELPELTDNISQHDLRDVLNGASDFGHALGIQLQYSRSVTGGYNGAEPWPAGNDDGNDSHMAVVQGMRLRFGADVQPLAGASRGCLAVFKTMQTYGFVDDDTTGGSPVALAYNADGSYAKGGAVNVRVQPPVRGAPDLAKQLPIDLSCIPWSKATLIAAGWDNLPNPTQ